MTRALDASEVLRLPVRLHGIQLGTPRDLVLDVGAARALALEVLCGDGARRFLPFAAARIGDGEVTPRSALMLLEERDVGFYRTHGETLGALRGREVLRGGTRLGTLADVQLGAGGAVVALVLDTDAGAVRVPPDERVRIAEPRRSDAA